MILSPLLDRLWQKGQEDDVYKDSLNEIPFPSQSTHMISHECKLIVGLEPTGIRTKCNTNHW